VYLPFRSSTLCTLIVLGLLVGCKDTSGPRNPTDATQVAVHSGDAQGANAGTAVPQPLAVLVTDADNDPVANVDVLFTVRTGGGTIAGGSARTNSDGIATSGVWTLGSSLGTNIVEASVVGLTSVAFTAMSRCISSGTLALGATLSGALAAADCRYPRGELTDRYTFTTTVQRAVRFSQSSSQVDTYLEIFDLGGLLLSANDDSANVPGAQTSALKMLLPPGSYEISPSSFEAAETGVYSMTAVDVPENENVCELVFAMRGITTNGTLATGDCTTGGGSAFLFKTVAMVMRAGKTYTITMNSAAFDTYLELAVLDGPLVTQNDNAVGTNARITFTPTVSNFYVIVASSSLPNISGAFTLIIE
jgi:hypothetical protein